MRSTLHFVIASAKARLSRISRCSLPITALGLLSLNIFLGRPAEAQPTSNPQAVVSVPCGADLQKIINTTAGGTTLRVAHLAANGVTRCQWGSYTLPWRPDNDLVTIETDGSVPTSGVRTSTSDSYLALFVAQNVGGWYIVFSTASPGPNAPVHGYRFVGLEITTPNDTAHASYGLVMLDGYSSSYTAADIPYNFDFEHCYIHGANPNQEIGRGIQADVNNLTVRDSYISEIHSTFIESNTIWGNTMTGNWDIENNDLQAAGENFFWGGSPVLVPNIVPNGLIFRYNYVHKPASWQTYRVNGANPYIVKNLMEFKAGTGLQIDSNVFEYSWNQSQGGYAILFTPRMYQTLSKATTVQNVSVTNNTLRHMVSGILLGLCDDIAVNTGFASLAQAMQVATKNFTIKNNLFDDMDGGRWGGGGSLGISLNTAAPTYYTHNITVDHNTFQFGSTVQAASYGVNYALGGGCNFPSVSPTDVVITYNIFGKDVGRDCQVGPDAVFPGSIFNHNTIVDTWVSQAVWNGPFAQSSVIIDSNDNPDQRGADVNSLGTLEPMVKSGRVCSADVSSQVTVARGGWHYSLGSRTYTQTLTLTNRGLSSVSGISVAIMNLSSSAQLINSAGTSGCGSSAGFQYLAPTNPSLVLAPGQSTILNMTVSSSTNLTISFSTLVLAGPGMK